MTGDATTCTVTGLTNGTAYTFTVIATNAVGDCPASTPPTPVTPAAVPDRAHRRDRDPRRQSGHGDLDHTARATVAGHRLHHHQLPGGITKTITGADTTTAHRHRADQRHRLHLHRQRHQRRRRLPRLRAVQRR